MDIGVLYTLCISRIKIKHFNETLCYFEEKYLTLRMIKLYFPPLFVNPERCMLITYRHNIFIIQRAWLMDYAVDLVRGLVNAILFFFFLFFTRACVRLTSRRTDSVFARLASLEELEESLIVLEQAYLKSVDGFPREGRRYRR